MGRSLDGFNGTLNGTLNGLSTDNQIWVGSSAINTGGTHINVRTLTAQTGIAFDTSTPGIFGIGLTGGGTAVEHLTGNTGGILNPTANNFNIVGPNSALTGFSPWIAGSGSTLTVNMPGTAKWVVNATANLGTHTTIASALTSASSGDTIFITPGTYTENITLKAGVNIVAFTVDGQTPNVTIVGKCTATFAGTCSISGIRLQTNSDNFLAVTGSSATIVNLFDCYLNCTNNTGMLNSSSGGVTGIKCNRCTGDLGTTGIAFFSNSGTGGIDFYYCQFTNTGGSSTASTCSGSSSGALNIFDSRFVSHNFTSTSSASALFQNSMFSNLTLSNTSSATVRYCTYGDIVANVGTSVEIQDSVTASGTAAPISGAGTVNYGGLIFAGTGSTISATTQQPRIMSNDAIKVVTPGAYPYTTTPQDGLIKVDTSSARTIVPLASPITGQRHIIKDTVGSAAANNITVTPSGKNIDGAASSTINVAYGSIMIVFTGTEWSII